MGLPTPCRSPVLRPASQSSRVKPPNFGVTWIGSGLIPFLQWRQNGVDILDATNLTYTIPATVIGQNGYAYSVVISNVFGDSVTSPAATLSVSLDTNPPVVLSASSLGSNSLNVVFSEPVSGTAWDANNYALSG